MNRQIVAKELLKIAKDLVAIDFPSQDALDKYLKAHPGADKSKHKVAPKRTHLTKPHGKLKPSGKALGKVKNVLKAHGLTGSEDELHELSSFKRSLGQRVPKKDWGKFYVRNKAKLKNDFIANMNPQNYGSQEAFKSAQERMKKMPVQDFGKILAAMMDEEEG